MSDAPNPSAPGGDPGSDPLADPTALPVPSSSDSSASGQGEAQAAQALEGEGEASVSEPETDSEVEMSQGQAPSAEPQVEAAAGDDEAPEPEDVHEEIRSDETVVHNHFTAPAHIALDRVDDDDTFLIRSKASVEDVSALATDIARLGQLFPIDVRLQPPDRFQVISGFRRVAALRFLQRDKVVARLHTDLTDADAMLMALAAAIHSRSVEPESLAQAREKLESEGRLTAAARDMLDKALATESALGPESVDEEVDADELAGDVTVRLGQCNQDLSLLADVFEDLDDERREALLTQLRYSADLVVFLEGKK